MKDIPQLGSEPNEREQRDAIHVAVAPVVAAQMLAPGDRVGLDRIGHATRDVRPIGIVDPFRLNPVNAGARFWLVLFPGTITSLRHDWDHPSFPQEERPFVPAGSSKEERRLREIASSIGIAYADMMAGADEWVESKAEGEWGEYLVQHGSDTWRDEFPRYVDEFWTLYEIVRGKTVPSEHRDSFFSCSC